MTSHPAVAKISFTGSVPTGKAVAAAAAPDLKRSTLELGGNDAAIVLDDADRRPWNGPVWGASNHTASTARDQADLRPGRTARRRGRGARAAGPPHPGGAGTEAGVQVGPVQNSRSSTGSAGLVADALGRGATGRRAGTAGAGRYFFAPTILTGVARDPIVDESSSARPCR